MTSPENTIAFIGTVVHEPSMILTLTDSSRPRCDGLPDGSESSDEDGAG